MMAIDNSNESVSKPAETIQATIPEVTEEPGTAMKIEKPVETHHVEPPASMHIEEPKTEEPHKLEEPRSIKVNSTIHEASIEDDAGRLSPTKIVSTPGINNMTLEVSQIQTQQSISTV